MRTPADRPTHPATAVAIGVLIAAGAAEIVGSVMGLAEGGAGSIAALSQPTSLLPLTLVVLIAPLGGRRQRIAAFFCASAALITRVVLATLLIVPGWRLGLAGTVSVAAGLLTGIGVFLLALVLVLRHRDLADEAGQEQLHAPVPASPQEPSPSLAAHRHATAPASPSTPVDLSRQPLTTRAPASWATTSTPWPRADEGDPDGTLIRPPRR